MRVFFFFIAISAILIGLGFHPSDYHDKPKCTDSHYVGAVPSSTSPSSSKANQSIHEPNRPKTDQQITNEIACSGLVAQWVAADTTERMFWFSIAGMALILVTLLETQAAGKLITQQNVNAVKATKAEFQPYISFEKKINDFRISFIADYETEPRIRFSNLKAVISNTGKTPAKNVCCTCVVEISGDLMLESGPKVFRLGPTADAAPLSLMEKDRPFYFEYGALPNENEVSSIVHSSQVIGAIIEITIRASFEDAFTGDGFRVFEGKFQRGTINETGPSVKTATIISSGETKPSQQDRDARNKEFKHHLSHES